MADQGMANVPMVCSSLGEKGNLAEAEFEPHRSVFRRLPKGAGPGFISEEAKRLYDLRQGSPWQIGSDLLFGRLQTGCVPIAESNSVSRRRPARRSLRDEEVVVRVICSDRGQHQPPRVLGTIEIHGADDQDVEIVNLTTNDETNAFRPGGGTGQDEYGRPHLTDEFHCRKCGRSPRMRRDKLVAAARVMAEHDQKWIDISALEQLSHNR